MPQPLPLDASSSSFLSSSSVVPQPLPLDASLSSSSSSSSSVAPESLDVHREAFVATSHLEGAAAVAAFEAAAAAAAAAAVAAATATAAPNMDCVPVVNKDLIQQDFIQPSNVPQFIQQHTDPQVKPFGGPFMENSRAGGTATLADDKHAGHHWGSVVGQQNNSMLLEDDGTPLVPRGPDVPKEVAIEKLRQLEYLVRTHPAALQTVADVQNGALEVSNPMTILGLPNWSAAAAGYSCVAKTYESQVGKRYIVVGPGGGPQFRSLPVAAAYALRKMGLNVEAPQPKRKRGKDAVKETDSSRNGSSEPFASSGQFQSLHNFALGGPYGTVPVLDQQLPYGMYQHQQGQPLMGQISGPMQPYHVPGPMPPFPPIHGNASIGGGNNGLQSAAMMSALDVICAAAAAKEEEETDTTAAATLTSPASPRRVNLHDLVPSV